MPKASSQKFIARNRAPRVQIEYDVEIYGAEKKVELPFIMGVMADLSGKPEESLPAVAAGVYRICRYALSVEPDGKKHFVCRIGAGVRRLGKQARGSGSESCN